MRKPRRKPTASKAWTGCAKRAAVLEGYAPDGTLRVP